MIFTRKQHFRFPWWNHSVERSKTIRIWKDRKILQQKAHETVMEINLNALVHNLNYYRSRIKPTTKLMAMVKPCHTEAEVLRLPISFSFIMSITCCCIHRWRCRTPVKPASPSDHGDESRKCKVLKRWFAIASNRRCIISDSLNQLNEVLRKHDGDPFRIHIKLTPECAGSDLKNQKSMSSLFVWETIKHPCRICLSHLAASDEAEPMDSLNWWIVL